jgi:hypothetical protein
MSFNGNFIPRVGDDSPSHENPHAATLHLVLCICDWSCICEFLSFFFLGVQWSVGNTKGSSGCQVLLAKEGTSLSFDPRFYNFAFLPFAVAILKLTTFFFSAGNSIFLG